MKKITKILKKIKIIILMTILMMILIMILMTTLMMKLMIIMIMLQITKKIIKAKDVNVEKKKIVKGKREDDDLDDSDIDDLIEENNYVDPTLDTIKPITMNGVDYYLANNIMLVAPRIFTKIKRVREIIKLHDINDNDYLFLRETRKMD